MLKPCVAMGWSLVLLAAAGASNAQSQPQSQSQMVVDGPVLTQASGAGAVAETRIGGQLVVATGTSADAAAPAARRKVEQVPAQGDLRNLDLSGRQLAGSRWADRTLDNVDLSGADLSRSDLRRTTLRNVDLSGVNLQGADLRGAKLINVEVGSGVHLRGATLMGGRVCQDDSCSLQ
ncbi:pentapeptide repeat-containing protein [Ottowia sp.]|uniref:pentapeptide repeat-containing protein n=1 Tax=Ottowia sp. TaxID=1898956 RepID=UPI003A864674